MAISSKLQPKLPAPNGRNAKKGPKQVSTLKRKDIHAGFCWFREKTWLKSSVQCCCLCKMATAPAEQRTSLASQHQAWNLLPSHSSSGADSFHSSQSDQAPSPEALLVAVAKARPPSVPMGLSSAFTQFIFLPITTLARPYSGPCSQQSASSLEWLQPWTEQAQRSCKD